MGSRIVQTIYKYEVGLGDTNVQIPKGGVVLSAQEQGETICIWVQLDDSNPVEGRVFEVFGTGHPISNGERIFIGTIQLMGGLLIFHVFEKVFDKIVP